MRPFEGQCLKKLKTICENDLVGLIKEFGVKNSVEDPIAAMLSKSSKDIITMLVLSMVYTLRRPSLIRNRRSHCYTLDLVTFLTVSRIIV